MPSHDIRVLGPDDRALHAGLMTMFGEAFDDPERYTGARPGVDHVRRLLTDHGFVALAAIADGAVIGGLAACELVKFESESSEFYIYDFAVLAAFRRKGVATALIERLCRIAAEREACTIFVQAERRDGPAIALYSGLGTREDVLHFDIEPR